MFLDDIVNPIGIEEAKATSQRLDPKCWKGYKKQGTKVKDGVRVNNCVPKESVEEDSWHNGSNAWSSENHEMVESQLSVGDPVIVTAPNEYEGKTGEIAEFSPSGKFVVVNLYNYGEHSMHLSDVEYNKYADEEVDEGVESSPVAGAITRRILMQRHDLLKQYGPELVGAAVDNVADYVGDVDEIGSSDVSAWVDQVERMLRDNPPEAFAEGWSDAVVSQRTGQPRTPYSVYIKGKKWKDFENDDHAEAVANKLRAKFKADGRDPSVITIAPTDYDKKSVNELDATTLKSYADKRGAQVAAMKADNPNAPASSPEWIKQAVPAQQVNLAKRKIARKERQQGVAEAGSPAQQAAIAIAKKKEQGVEEAIVASGPAKPLDDRAVRKLVWDTMKINADTGDQAIQRALSVLAKKPQSRMVQDLQDKFQSLADRLAQGLAEAETDYSKRRQRERDVDAGKPVAKQRQSKMTDYQKRRAQDKKDMELGEMDKSQKGAPGWNIDDNDAGGKESTGTPVTAKNFVKAAAKELDRTRIEKHTPKKNEFDIKESYWTRLQNERNTKIAGLVGELTESIKDVK